MCNSAVKHNAAYNPGALFKIDRAYARAMARTIIGEPAIDHIYARMQKINLPRVVVANAAIVFVQ
jgi:hypothetical protein